MMFYSPGRYEDRHTLSMQFLAIHLIMCTTLSWLTVPFIVNSDMVGYTGFTISPVKGRHAAGNRKTEQGGDKDSVIDQSAKLLGSKRYQQKQNRGRIRDQTKQAINFEIFGWDFSSLYYGELI